MSETTFYQGTIIDGGLWATDAGDPLEVLELKANAVWSAETEKYEPVVDGHEITANVILFTDPPDFSLVEETESSRRLQEISGWDGASLVKLSEMNMTGVPVQWREEVVEANGYLVQAVTGVNVADLTSDPDPSPDPAERRHSVTADPQVIADDKAEVRAARYTALCAEHLTAEAETARMWNLVRSAREVATESEAKAVRLLRELTEIVYPGLTLDYSDRLVLVPKTRTAGQKEPW